MSTLIAEDLVADKDEINAVVASSGSQQSNHVIDDGNDDPDEASDTFEASGVRPRKPCNCTKSQCLKLYCDCFANGEFCFNCNCNNCFNNIANEEERQKAIKQCLERNPLAFKPKVAIYLL
jgi:hypothetical protein